MTAASQGLPEGQWSWNKTFEVLVMLKSNCSHQDINCEVKVSRSHCMIQENMILSCSLFSLISWKSAAMCHLFSSEYELKYSAHYLWTQKKHFINTAFYCYFRTRTTTNFWLLWSWGSMLYMLCQCQSSWLVNDMATGCPKADGWGFVATSLFLQRHHWILSMSKLFFYTFNEHFFLTHSTDRSIMIF